MTIIFILYILGMANQFFIIRSAERFGTRKIEATPYQMIAILMGWPLMAIVSIYWYFEDKIKN